LRERRRRARRAACRTRRPGALGEEAWCDGSVVPAAARRTPPSAGV
jgi:hypothetical protein